MFHVHDSSLMGSDSLEAVWHYVPFPYVCASCLFGFQLAIKKSKKENSGTKKDWLNKNKNKTVIPTDEKKKRRRFCHFLFSPVPRRAEGRSCSPCLSHSNTASKTNVHWSLPWAMMNHMKQHKYKSTYHKAQRPTNLTDLPYHLITQLTQISPKQSQILTHKEW